MQWPNGQSALGPGAGGAGGGRYFPDSPYHYDAGPGADSPDASLAGGTAGVSDQVNALLQTDGGAGESATTAIAGAGGGGGGAAGKSATSGNGVTARNGAAGGLYGGGGGGGGATLSYSSGVNTVGSGGDGAYGVVIIEYTFV